MMVKSTPIPTGQGLEVGKRDGGVSYQANKWCNHAGLPGFTSRRVGSARGAVVGLVGKPPL